MSSLSCIYFAGCGIKGQIPNFLQTTISPIQELDLSVNLLNGSIPSWIGGFNQLYILNLSRNNISSYIPNSFRNLHDLSILDLHSNRLTGSISPIFETEQSIFGGSLKFIDLSDNKFSSGIEEIGLRGQCDIQFLNLSHNLLKGKIPNAIGRMNSINSLDLSFNKLGFNLPEVLENLTSLEVLKLQENEFNGNIPIAFLKLIKLRELNLSYNLLEGKIPEGKPLIDFPESSYYGNKGLCGKPLGPCKL
jgi:Leucine-rich repeat (LRR) protein